MITYDTFFITNTKYNNDILYNSNDIIINLLPYDYTYGSLSSRTNNYIDHKIKEVKNKAPSLEHYYQYFFVNNRNIENGVIKQEFFDKVNEAFICTNNFVFKYNKTPLYYLHHTGQLTKKEIRKIYCEMYKDLLLKNKQSKYLFNIIREIYNENKIIINTDLPVDDTQVNEKYMINTYKDTKQIFTDVHCLIEMLVNYDTENKLLWECEYK